MPVPFLALPGMYILSISIFSFLVGWIAEIAVAAMAIHWATDPFIIFRHAFPFEIAFGLLIPLIFLSLILFLMLLLDSRSKVYLGFWIGAVVVITVVPIALTSPPSLDSWVNRWDRQWTNTSHAMSFQYEKSCCGWRSYKDRAIYECPFKARSGCQSMVTTWIKARYDEVFLSLLFITSLYVYCMVSVTWKVVRVGVDCIWAEIEIPFLTPSVYGR